MTHLDRLRSAARGLRLGRTTIPYLMSVLRSRSQRKHALSYLRSLRKGYLLRQPSPWLTFDAIAFLQCHLSKGMRVFEYGSGGSTLFWLHSGATCVSVEHDRGWFHAIRSYLGEEQPVDYRLVPPELSPSSGAAADAADPNCYVSNDASFSGYTFRQYASQIDEFPDGHFDVVLVDGRVRPSCIMHSARKIKAGGVMVLDNADREYYTAKTQQYLSGFDRRMYPGVGPFNRYVWRTDIYLRLV